MSLRKFYELIEWFPNEFRFNFDVSITWITLKLGRSIINYLLRYLKFILVPTFNVTSVMGFALLINIITQMWSGFLLALYYIPDPSLVITNREEYMNEIWWYFFVYKIHTIGVDSLFTLSYLHIIKKIFIKNFIGANLDGWLTGSYSFLVFHVVVFLGITLSTNHLGDLTLTIGATIFWSLFAYKHKIVTLLFTNRHLNAEQLIRFMLAHYVVAWYYVYLVQMHVLHIHEMWDPDSKTSVNEDNVTPKSNWIIDALQKETLFMIGLYIGIMVYSLFKNHKDILPVNFSFFEQWSETEVEDINFFIVGPHWYFRPHMGLLTVCAQHYEGLFWLIMYYVLIAMLPVISNLYNIKKNINATDFNNIPMQESLIQFTLFIFFVMSLLYVGNTLPCARFYYEEEEGFFGNSFLRLSYQYIYVYLFMIIHVVDKLESMYKQLMFAKRNQLSNDPLNKE